MDPYGKGMTLIEVVVVVVVLGILIGLLFPFLVKAREEARKKACQGNLSRIGRGIYAYTQSRVEFYPFSWGPADRVDGTEEPRIKDAMTSIAELYPQYLRTSALFRCPSTNRKPFFSSNIPCLPNTSTPSRMIWKPEYGPYYFTQRNHTLNNSSYGYDCRVYPSAVSNHLLMADMDGSQEREGGRSANHRDGHNVLLVGGAVKWQTNNYCSYDPLDNIFAEDPWHADTDNFISDNTPPGADRTPGAFNDLSISYNGYPDLRPMKPR